MKKRWKNIMVGYGDIVVIELDMVFYCVEFYILVGKIYVKLLYND